MDGLKTAIGLNLPSTLSGSLSLNGLTNTVGLTLPLKIGDYISLNGLKSVVGLKLPDKYDNTIYLNGMTSAAGLIQPKNFKGKISLKINKSYKNYKNGSLEQIFLECVTGFYSNGWNERGSPALYSFEDGVALKYEDRWVDDAVDFQLLYDQQKGFRKYKNTGV